MGQDYAQEKKGIHKVPTTVINHTTGIDAFVATNHFNGQACFLVGDHIKNIPMISYLIIASGGLFAPRGGTPEAREATV